MATYQKGLGPKSARIASKMTTFDPVSMAVGIRVNLAAFENLARKLPRLPPTSPSNAITARRLGGPPLSRPKAARGEWALGRAGALDVVPHQFVGVQLWRIAGQEVQFEFAIGRA